MRFAAGRARAPLIGGPSRPGGSIDDAVDGRGGPTVAGVFVAELASAGTRFERTRIGGFFGGPSVRSIAVAGRTGGVPGIGGAACDRIVDDPGDAVCARGGGGGGVAAAASGPACEAPGQDNA